MRVFPCRARGGPRAEGRRGDGRFVNEQPAWSFAELLRELRGEAR